MIVLVNDDILFQ